MPPHTYCSSEMLTGVHLLRAFAAISVVLYHCGGSIASEKYQSIAEIGSITRGLDAGVDIFFVISGFVISLPLFQRRKTCFKDWIGNRLLRIYPLAGLTALIYMLVNWVVFNRPPELASILSSVLLLPLEATPIPVVLWTLKQEILFYV